MTDAKLDRLLLLFAKAKYEIELLLSEISDPIGTAEAARLLNWIDNNKEAADYSPYCHLAEEIKEFSQDINSLEFEEYPFVEELESVLADFNAVDIFALVHEVAGVPFLSNTSFSFFESCEQKYDAIIRSIPGCDPGHVYILSNPSMPGLVKIGFTRRSPELRADELNTTSTPTPFVIAYQQLVPNCEVIESKVHERLSKYRVSGNREFFRIEIDDAIRAIKEIIRGK